MDGAQPYTYSLLEFLRAFGRFPAKDVGYDNDPNWPNIRSTAIEEIDKRLAIDKVVLDSKANDELLEIMVCHTLLIYGPFSFVMVPKIGLPTTTRFPRTNKQKIANSR